LSVQLGPDVSRLPGTCGLSSGAVSLRSPMSSPFVGSEHKAVATATSFVGRVAVGDDAVVEVALFAGLEDELHPSNSARNSDKSTRCFTKKR